VWWISSQGACTNVIVGYRQKRENRLSGIEMDSNVKCNDHWLGK
jgi:hypothetical protein